MTDTEKEFVELSKRYEIAKDELKMLKEKLVDLEINIGLISFQDDEGTVYSIVRPSGTFIYFDTISYKRTRREGERSGTLSLKEAKELGFDVN